MSFLAGFSVADDGRYSRNVAARDAVAVQGTEYGNTVQEASVYGRSRPEYDPLGIRANGFIYSPFASFGVFFDDNVLSQGSNQEQEDVYFNSQAGVKAESDWGRHEFGFIFSIDDKRYLDLTSDDTTNLTGGLSGRLDIYHDLSVSSNVSFAQLHEARGSSDADITANEPTEYTHFLGTVTVDKKFSNSSLQVGGSIQNYDYKGSGQDSRDGYIYSAVVKKSYFVSPGYSFFGLLDANFRDFDSGDVSNAALQNRDSDGLEARVGVEFEITRLIAGEASIGYLYQDYDDNSLSDVEDLAFKFALLWNPTKLMTVSLDATRVVSETTVSDASGHVDTIIVAKVDYEIMRNLIGSPYVSYLFEDFVGSSREDEQITAGVSLEYLINRKLRAKTFYTYTNKDSNDNNFDYDKNIFGGEIKLQF